MGDAGSQWRGGGSGNCHSRPLPPRRIPQTTRKVIFPTGQVTITHSLEWPCVSSRCKLIKGSEVAQLCPTLCDPMDCSPPGSSVHGIFPGRNTGVGCHFLLQEIFPTQGLNPGLPHCRQTLCPLSHQGSPVKVRVLPNFGLLTCKCGTPLCAAPWQGGCLASVQRGWCVSDWLSTHLCQLGASPLSHGYSMLGWSQSLPKYVTNEEFKHLGIR